VPVRDPGPLFTLEAPRTFEAYLTQFTAKQRYNLKRQVRLLSDAGHIELRCLTSEDSVGCLLDGISNVQRSAWKHDSLFHWARIDCEPALRDLARKGLLRGYLLLCGKVHVAFAVGFLFRDTYHYAETGYSESFRQYSPGTVLLYLLIQDLIESAHIRRINFGIGDSPYKRHFGNRAELERGILLLLESCRLGPYLRLFSILLAAKQRLRAILMHRATLTTNNSQLAL